LTHQTEQEKAKKARSDRKNRQNAAGRDLFLPKDSHLLRERGTLFTFVYIFPSISSSFFRKKSSSSFPQKIPLTLTNVSVRPANAATAACRNKSRTRRNKSGTCWNFSGTSFYARRRRISCVFDQYMSQTPFFLNTLKAAYVHSSDAGAGAVDFLRFSRPSRTLFHPLSLHDKRRLSPRRGTARGARPGLRRAPMAVRRGAFSPPAAHKCSRFFSKKRELASRPQNKLLILRDL